MGILKTSGILKTTDCHEIYYETYGSSGPILLLTYGLACPINHWHNQVSYFSKNHRVLVYDLRGHGKSKSEHLRDLTVDRLAKDCIELLEHVYPKEKAFFAGHSFGCPISLRVGSLAPDLCEGIFLINGFYKNPFLNYISTKKCIELVFYARSFYAKAPSLTQWVWSHASDNDLFRIVAGLTGGFNLERMPYKDMEIYTKGVAALPFSNFLDHFEALFHFDGSEHFEETLAPTYIIHGARDGIVPLDQNQEMAEKLKNGHFYDFPEGSHCTQLDLPFEINELMEAKISDQLEKV